MVLRFFPQESEVRNQTWTSPFQNASSCTRKSQESQPRQPIHKLYFTLGHPPIKKAVLANRAPRSLLRFVFTLAALLRSETRALVEPLFHVPPRKPHLTA